MALDKVKSGRISIEIVVINPERLLNIFWTNGIKVLNVKKINIATLRLEIEYLDYKKVVEIVERVGGKVKVLSGRGFIFLLGKLKKRLSLVVGAVLFIGILYFLSTYIWVVEINVKENIAPFEVRQQLMSLGIKPGISKKVIDVKDIEKKLENLNPDILWLRIRVEGSTLKVNIEEKVNPPSQLEGQYGNLVATKEGEIQRIYTFGGRAAVKVGQFVKEGDVVIEGIDGKEEQQYIVPPKGIVIANTFYEKEMQIKVDGVELQRSGRKDSDIYIQIFGKKIYIKKSIKGFKEYDKIEKSSKLFNEVIYYERVEKSVKLTEEEAINTALKDLEKSLINDLDRNAKIVNKLTTKERDNQGNLRVKVVFVVEQNIVSELPVNY